MNALLPGVTGSSALLALACSVTLVWLLACFACRWAQSGLWQRCIWQTAVIALAVLILGEMCGLGPALDASVRLTSQAHLPAPTTPTGPLTSDPDLPELAAKAEPTPSNVVLLPPATIADDHGLFPDSTAEDLASEFTPAVPHIEDSASPRIELAQPETRTSASSGNNGLAMLWVGGTLLLFARLAVGQLLLQRFGAQRGPPHLGASISADRTRVTRLARQLGLNGRVHVVRSGVLNGPVAFGLLWPTIGLPVRFERDFSEGEQDAMLAHELAHLAHGDPMWRLAADIVAAVLWWHPAVWLTRARFQTACELAADEASLVVNDGPTLLAGCLVTLAKRISPAIAPGWLAAEGSGLRSALGRRVSRLLDLPPTARRPARASLTAICVFSAAALVAFALVSSAWARPQAALTGDRSMKSIFASSWRQSLAGGLLIAVLGPSAPATADDEPRREDRPAAEKREDRPEARREGDRERPEARREGERREGDRPAPERREGDRPRTDGERPMPPRREGERPESARPPREGEGAQQRMHEERRRIEEQLERMGREAGEHARAGHKDVAERIEREMQGLKRRLEQLRRMASDRPDGPPEGRRPAGPPEGRRPDGPPEGRRPDGPPEGRRPDGPPEGRRPDGPPEGRRPDGPPEGRRPDGPPEGRRPDGPPEGRRPDGPPPGPPRDELLSVLRELRAEVQNLRQEVNDLKARMRDMGPRREGERER